jgi:DNA-binding MarR family transcriptional regulator
MPTANKPAASVSPLPDMPCACATVRRAARLVTQMYGEHLSPFGLEAAQLTLLMAIAKQPGKSQTQLSTALGYDKTTLSRNLKLLQRSGWVTTKPFATQREAGLHLTPQGNKLVARTHAGWDRAQQQLRSAMSSSEWNAMWKGMRALTRAAHQATTPGA